ncbi:unnamed protein product [Prunus armeniaca]|uniref:Uncharacterized protein n=1 Tax=Prunus armeniaca TaxID=36596 RepID=A0A6J5V8U4_PRUAR|nr:unnamed protein product [Prunus armeniaca]
MNERRLWWWRWRVAEAERDMEGKAVRGLGLGISKIKLGQFDTFFKLDERKRRKEFKLERNLLYPDPFEKNLPPEEREIYHRFKVFMRFHSNEEHKELLKSIIKEQQVVKRILDLQVGPKMKELKENIKVRTYALILEGLVPSAPPTIDLDI